MLLKGLKTNEITAQNYYMVYSVINICFNIIKMLLHSQDS